MKQLAKYFITAVICIAATSYAATAQTTDLTYQGQLQSLSAAANGNFDFEFLLFDSGGSQIGPVLTRNGVSVSNGIFSVNLDFGSSFPGASRFLEIRVRPNGGGAFTTLSPRQPVANSPYSVRSLASNTADNATNAVTATNFTGNLNGDVTGTQSATTVARLQNRNVAATAPSNGQVLKYNSATSQWTPDTDNTGAGGGTITGVTAGTGLTGGGTTGGVILGIAPGGVSSNEIANNAVTDQKIATGAVTAAKIPTGQVVKNLNGLTDNVTLAQGANITITPSGNTLTIASTGGGGNAILNQATQQAGANFNISGNGTAGGTLSGNIVNATTQYNLSGNRVLSNTGTDNLFVGVNAGVATTGPYNSFFGAEAGRDNSTGDYNSFFGSTVGRKNTVGSGNSFFGTEAGYDNIEGSNNSFFGVFAGGNNLARSNSFFGALAGSDNQTGTRNSFFGQQAGEFNVSGSNNTMIGFGTVVGSPNLTDATAIGAIARVDQSNSLVLGATAGVNGATVPTNVGIGTTTPASRLDIAATGDGAELLRFSTERPWVFKQASFGSGSALRLQSTSGIKHFEITALGNTNVATFVANDAAPRVGIGTTVPDQTLSVNGNASKLGGTTWLAFSDARLKKIHGRFTSGLNAVMRLSPLRYEYKKDNSLGLRSEGEHIGFSAQEVEKVIPEAVIKNEQGYRMVNSDPILWTMLNAIKEQQKIIENQQHQINQLKKITCVRNKKARICKKETN